jgi:hypothetical protein
VGIIVYISTHFKYPSTDLGNIGPQIFRIPNVAPIEDMNIKAYKMKLPSRNGGRFYVARVANIVHVRKNCGAPWTTSQILGKANPILFG